MKTISHLWRQFDRAPDRRRYAIALGCVLTILGVLVLIRDGSARPPGSPTGAVHHVISATTSPTRAPLSGPSLQGHLALSQSTVLANGTRQLFAEVELRGVDEPGAARRAPLAVAIVLDHSGSMAGAKLADAKSAILRFVDGLADEDRVSVTIYDDSSEVLVPMTSVGDARDRIRERLSRVRDGGGTNIPSGLLVGMSSLRGAFQGSVRRVVLFSDGLDNSGTPFVRVQRDVQQSAREGVAISAFGIGTDYDEHYMSAVAEAGNGNYGYLGNQEMLASFVSAELAESAGTVVDTAIAELNLPEGWRVVRVLGSSYEGSQGVVRMPLGSIARGGSRRATIELEVDAPRWGNAGAVSAAVTYRAVASGEVNAVSTKPLLVAVSDSEVSALQSRDLVVWGRANALLIGEGQTLALDAWRAGRRDEARKIMAQQVNAATVLVAEQKKGGVAKEELDQLGSLQGDLAEGYATVESEAPSSKLGKAKALSLGARTAARSKSAAGAGAAQAAPMPTAAAADSLY